MNGRLVNGLAWWLGALAVVAFLAGPALAVDEVQGAGPTWTAPGLKLDYNTRTWIDVDRLAVSGPDADWMRFCEVMGPGWIVTPDAAFGVPRWILGPGYRVGPAPLSAADAVREARALACALAAPLGLESAVDVGEPQTAQIVNAHGQTLLAVDFPLAHAGYPVRTLLEARRVQFRFNLTLGKLVMIGSGAVPGLAVDTRAKLSPDAAVVAALQQIPGFQPGQGTVSGFSTYILAGLDDAGRTRARLVHDVRIAVTRPAHDWHVILDARTGDRLHVADDVCGVDVIGTVALGSLDAGGGTPPMAPFSVKPAPFLHVAVQGGNKATTDASGAFRIAHGGSAPVTVTGRFAGDWCTIHNQQGANTSFSQPATPGTAVNIVLNGTHVNEFVTAEATCYDWVNRVHAMVGKRVPNFTALPGITTNVNLNNNCNAFFQPATNSINFFTSGGGCNNTAISEVICHEWGHAFHQWFAGSISNRGLSEGIADHMGLYLTAQRVMGRDFYTTAGKVVRDYRPGGGANNTQWPLQGGSGHRDGQIWAGTMMDMRDYLITKHGAVQGVDIAEIISISQYALHKPVDMPSAIKAVMLVDDNDANLLNGTPNFVEIAQAADRHNLPRPPDPDIVRFTHTPLTNTRDVVNPYRIVTKIVSTEGTISRASLSFRFNGGSPVTVNLVKGTGDMYSASIPAQPAVTRIGYWLSATDSKNNTQTLPRSGDQEFTVGHEIVAFADDFEQDRGWKRDPGDTATTGNFERADPVANRSGTYIGQPEDDHTPGSGTLCWVTQNGNRQQFSLFNDVDNGSTAVVSPALDLSGFVAGAAQLEFACWFVDWLKNDDALVAEVSSDDGKSWKAVHSITRSDPNWTEVKGVTIPVPYTTTMRIRFKVADTPDNSYLDALVDDVKINSMDDNVAALRAQTAAPPPGGTVDYTLEAVREPGAIYFMAWSLRLDPVVIPGLGVMDLGLPVFPLMGGQLGATGKAAFKVPLPADPNLKGIAFHTQSLVQGKTTIFSNVWSFTVQ